MNDRRGGRRGEEWLPLWVCDRVMISGVGGRGEAELCDDLREEQQPSYLTLTVLINYTKKKNNHQCHCNEVGSGTVN